MKSAPLYIIVTIVAAVYGQHLITSNSIIIQRCTHEHVPIINQWIMENSDCFPAAETYPDIISDTLSVSLRDPENQQMVPVVVDKQRTFIAYYSETAVGFIRIWFIKDYAWITQLAVDRSYQRRGYGQALLSYALQDISAHGIKYVFLGAVHQAKTAHKLYEKMGFKPCRSYEDLILFFRTSDH
jgi:ribosomal protein S18 acetylase RimI-like enzyme